jgi:hypothetical protein
MPPSIASMTRKTRAKARAKTNQPPSFAVEVGRALRRSAKDAQKMPRMYGMPFYVRENGKVVANKP